MPLLCSCCTAVSQVVLQPLLQGATACLPPHLFQGTPAVPPCPPPSTITSLLPHSTAATILQCPPPTATFQCCTPTPLPATCLLLSLPPLTTMLLLICCLPVSHCRPVSHCCPVSCSCCSSQTGPLQPCPTDLHCCPSCHAAALLVPTPHLPALCHLGATLDPHCRAFLLPYPCCHTATSPLVLLHLPCAATAKMPPQHEPLSPRCTPVHTTPRTTTFTALPLPCGPPHCCYCCY